MYFSPWCNQVELAFNVKRGMILLSIRTGLLGGIKSESHIFGLKELEGNRALAEMLPMARGRYLEKCVSLCVS